MFLQSVLNLATLKKFFNSKGSTLYHETSNPDDILTKIHSIVPVFVEGFEVFGGDNIDRTNEDLNQMLESGVLKPFAQLETRRQWFQKVN
jgi:hypothetical protein